MNLNNITRRHVELVISYNMHGTHYGKLYQITPWNKTVHTINNRSFTNSDITVIRQVYITCKHARKL